MVKKEITTIYVTEDGHRFYKKEEAEKYEMEHCSKEDLYGKIKELEKKVEQLESDLVEEKSKKMDTNIFPSKPVSPWVQPSPCEPNPNGYPKPWDCHPFIGYNKTYVGTKNRVYQTLNESEYNKLSEEDKKGYVGVPESQVNF